MPDRPLNIPDELLAPVQTAQAAHAANWALTFGNADRTNLARRQHNDDLATYAQVLSDAQQAHQEQMLIRDQGARELFFKRQDAERKADEARAKAGHDALVERRAAELHPLNLQLKEAQIRNTGAATALQTAEKLKREEHTGGFTEHLTQFIQGGGDLRSPEGKAALAVGISSFPNADPAMISKYGAALFPGEKLTPDELVDRVTAAQARNPNSRVTMNGVTVAPVKPEKDNVLPSLEKERALHAKMLDRAKRIRAKATDESVIADADADIAESEKALAEAESQIRSHREGGTTGEPTAIPSPEAKPKIVRQNGVTYTLQEDGSYK